MGISEVSVIYVHPTDTNSRQNYKCGHCGVFNSGRTVAGYEGTIRTRFLVCTSCCRGTTWDSKIGYIPGHKPGDALNGLPPEVNEAYEEARTCFSVKAYTACELICRKILMHIAVDKGDEEGKHFEEYLDYLESKGYITPPIKSWTDQIRQNGNSSTHELQAPSEERAEETLMFTMELLRIIYEMAEAAKKYAPAASPGQEITK
jgi:hypothetical protein